MAHFKQLILRKCEPKYERADPLVGRWKSIRGYADHGHYRSLLDLMEHHNVIWRSNESRWDVTPFHDICWYSGWIMASKDKMCRHLPERVLRHYDYAHTIPDLLRWLGILRHQIWLWPSWSLLSMSLASRRGVIRSWRTRCGSMRWGTWNGSTVYFILLWSSLRYYTTHVPPYKEVSVEQQCARQVPELLQIIENIIARVDNTLGFLICMWILSLPALWRASSLSIALCRRCRFPGVGVGVIVHMRSKILF